MQKSKHILKRILMCFVAMLMCLSPVLLAGCTAGGSTGGSGGGSGSGSGSGGGDSSGSGSSDGGFTTDIEGSDYLSNYKITYRPSNGDDLNQFMANIKVQVNEIAFSLIRHLYAEYGLAYSNNAFSGIKVIKIDVGQDGQYQKTEVLVADDPILKNAKPLFSSNLSITDSKGLNVYSYNVNEHYGKYFNHQNAIFADYDFAGNLYNWQWNGGLTLTDETETADNLNAFVNNLVYRKKMELALMLISAGYDISPNGTNYAAYDNGAKLIEQLRTTHAADDIAFYNAVDEYVFANYYALIDHSGYTDAEISYISNFIQNEVIGTNLVALDNTRYFNVYVIKNGWENQFYPTSANSLPSKYNKFLSEESFASFYYDYQLDEKDANKAIYSRKFYTSSFNTSNLPENEVLNINLLSDLSQQIFVHSAQGFQQNNGNTIQIPSSSLADSDYVIATLNDINFREVATGEIYQLTNKFIDTSGDGVFTADFWDIDGDGSTTNIICDQIDGYTSFLFSVRKQYFKNYVNTSYEVAKKVVRAPKDDAQTAKYGQRTFDYTLKYPIIPASFYADYVNDDILLNENGNMNMSTGYKRYQNMVIMPKQTFNLEEFYMFLTRQPDATGVTHDFNVTIYARYYDAATNTFATWGTGESETQFYNCGTVLVTPAVELYEISDPLGINLKQILSSAKINGHQKGNCTLYKFNNLPPNSANNPTLITEDANAAKMFDFVDLPNGQRTVTYNCSYLAEESRTSYLELLFATDAGNNFQFALLPTEANV